MADTMIGQYFDSLTNGVKDLIKYKIVAVVNTGDKTYDNLINTILLSLLSFVFAFLSRAAISNILENWHHKNSPLTKKSLKYYESKLKNLLDIGLLTKVYFTDCNELKIRVEHAYEAVYDVPSILFDTEERKLTILSSKKKEELKNEQSKPDQAPKDDKKDDKKEEKQELIVLFVDKNGMIGSVKNSNFIYYSSISTFNSFMNTEVSIDKKKKIIDDNTTLKIRNNDRQIIGKIYRNRTLDAWVSKHKDMIRKLIQNYKRVNDPKIQASSYEISNLGFLIHGPPGTGKTHLVKAIANELEMDVIMVNMREIKTRKSLEYLFKQDISAYIRQNDNEKECIYLLEEFDCVSGVLKSREQEEEEKTFEMEKRELNDRYIKILQAKNSNTEKATQELDEIKSKLAELENRLTLDTFLTVLDGPIEMRGRVVIATTNYPDKLDKALLRPGRFDRCIMLDKFTEDETRELVEKIYLSRGINKNSRVFKELQIRKIKSGVFTPAEIISLCSKHGDLFDVLEQICEN